MKVIVDLPDDWDYNAEAIYNAVKAAVLRQQSMKLSLAGGELVNKDGLDAHVIAEALLTVAEDSQVSTDEARIVRLHVSLSDFVTLSFLT